MRQRNGAPRNDPSEVSQAGICSRAHSHRVCVLAELCMRQRASLSRSTACCKLSRHVLKPGQMLTWMHDDGSRTEMRLCCLECAFRTRRAALPPARVPRTWILGQCTARPRAFSNPCCCDEAFCDCVRAFPKPNQILIRPGGHVTMLFVRGIPVQLLTWPHEF
eukprot:67667-Rhodomonas_salina.5